MVWAMNVRREFPSRNWRRGKGYQLMSGKRYQVVMASSAHRRYKKFDPFLKQKIKEEANKFSEDPHYARNLIYFLAVKDMGYKFSDVAKSLNIHPVTVARGAEKGRKLVDKYEGIWDIVK